ncbi:MULTISPECIES: hemerythrin domain-containing protein [Lysinibacillus]|uniref:Hemerythrin-like domain-containing protein n=1 Tax=Lysinibacillus antri TaxID=2498145 RepID=A0A3S0P5Z0_9BACI|nr:MULTISPECIES: hemerythrin domain-containing protein [Lysinibacillus]RUL52224.1 hypothetical protein EK386_10255 [Lysinibacillus antri]TSI05201.1 hemerythrin domain-containing protein [Lysinibacillus sp. BW-2-10]
MVGPALNQLHAHRAIHEGGLTGAIDRMEEFMELYNAKKTEEANVAADDLLDYWETRVLSHAEAEESGFYQAKVDANPDLKEAVTKLIRDHDILRMIVKDIHEIRQKEGLNEAVIQKLYALITVNELHSREEERLLFE